MEIPETIIGVIIAAVIAFTSLMIALFWKFHNIHLDLERQISELKSELQTVNHELFLLSPIKEFIQKFGTEGAERVFKGGKK